MGLGVCSLNALAGCASSAGPQVAPVPDGPPPSVPAPAAAPAPAPAPAPGPGTGDGTTSAAPAAPNDPAGAPTAGLPATDADRQLVQDLLDRYDRALTDVSAAPESVDDPADPLLGAWHQIVPAESELSESVLGRIRDRRAEGLLVEPVASGGLSYVHHTVDVVRATPPGDVEAAREELAFTWCGWSPGLGRRVGGPVVDDTVAHALGTGRIIRSGPDAPWVLASLIESELTLLPPGSADPC